VLGHLNWGRSGLTSRVAPRETSLARCAVSSCCSSASSSTLTSASTPHWRCFCLLSRGRGRQRRQVGQGLAAHDTSDASARSRGSCGAQCGCPQCTKDSATKVDSSFIASLRMCPSFRSTSMHSKQPTASQHLTHPNRWKSDGHEMKKPALPVPLLRNLLLQPAALASSCGRPIFLPTGSRAIRCQLSGRIRCARSRPVHALGAARDEPCKFCIGVLGYYSEISVARLCGVQVAV
jgi:hypothetical protein